MLRGVAAQHNLDVPSTRGYLDFPRKCARRRSFDKLAESLQRPLHGLFATLYCFSWRLFRGCFGNASSARCGEQTIGTRCAFIRRAALSSLIEGTRGEYPSPAPHVCRSCFRISVVSLLTPALHRHQRVLLRLINLSTFSEPACSDWDSALQIPVFAPDVLPAVGTRKQYAICTLWVFFC